MLEKSAILGVAKDEQGFLLVDKNTKKGARMQDEMMLQLTLSIWEFCDKMEVEDIVKEMTHGVAVLQEQLDILKRVVTEALNFFVQAGWAKEADGKSAPKKETGTDKKIEKKKDKKR